jgi:hypothetical protein
LPRRRREADRAVALQKNAGAEGRAIAAGAGATAAAAAGLVVLIAGRVVPALSVMLF